MGTHAHSHAHTAHAHDGHSHAHHGAGSARASLIGALILTFAFMIVEVIVGWLSHSLALVADAWHMLSDSGTLLVSIAVATIAMRPRSRQKTYGYRRAEVIAALGNAATLGFAAVWIVREGIARITAPEAVAGKNVFFMGVAGLTVNLIAAYLLSRGARDNLNVRSALYHVLGDALGSVAAIVAGVAVSLWGFTLADPIASLMIAALLVYGAWNLVREATHVLMEGTPDGLDLRAIEQTITNTPGVASAHDLHVWAVTPGQPILTAHVIIAEGSHGTDVAHRVGRRVAATHKIDHVTIQPEAPEPGLVSLRRK